MKDLRTSPIVFSLKTELLFSFLLNFFFSLNKTAKNLYTDILEMFNLNLKTSIHKYPISSRQYNFFIANVSDFCRYLKAKS